MSTPYTRFRADAKRAYSGQTIWSSALGEAFERHIAPLEAAQEKLDAVRAWYESNVTWADMALEAIIYGDLYRVLDPDTGEYVLMREAESAGMPRTKVEPS